MRQTREQSPILAIYRLAIGHAIILGNLWDTAVQSRARNAAIIAGLMWALPVHAGPLGLGLPNLPNVRGTLGNATNRTVGGIETDANVVRDAVGRPRVPRALEKDGNGFRVVRGEVLALSPTAGSLAAAQRLNFSVLRQETLSTLGLSVVTLRVPDGMSATEALDALRKADPSGTYDLDHIYDPSGATGAGQVDRPGQGPEFASSLRVGMIDGGVDHRHDAFAHATIIAKPCDSESNIIPTKHGTAVASLLVGSDDDVAGALPGATLYAADVYCGRPDGGNANAIARALAWFAENDVPAVNVSLSGPPNAILAAAVNAFVNRGRVIVAAVGNDGPAAPVEYPAGYPGVAGVTSVDDRQQIDVEANRGPDVAFAARGVDVPSATIHGSHDSVSGTSFAAPIVTARFALLLAHSDKRALERTWTTLEREAVHLGPPGRNDIFGYGLLDRPQSTTTAEK
jgi:hypothetical protein